MAKTKPPAVETPAVADAASIGTADAGSVRHAPDAERIAGIKAVAKRLADVPIDGVQALTQFLIIRGYSVEVAQAALDRFASAGFWKATTGEEFGDRPRKLAI